MDDTAKAGAPGECPACGTAPADPADAAITHCEWCGAEYPVPDTTTSPLRPPSPPGA